MTTLFDNFLALLKEAATDPETMTRPVKPSTASSDGSSGDERPLTAMQRAYLLGRTAQLPLGGVAMQDFREYHGIMDSELLRSRLAKMVQRYKSLRTFIDVERLMAVVHDETVPNLQEIDLTGLTSQDALKQVQKWRDDYSHSILDLSRSPWDITIYRLENDLLIVFARFDALILDGQSISALMVELFEGQSPILQSVPEELSNMEEAAALRQVDIVYWKTKLSNMGNTAQLPWGRPLMQLATSRYERQSAVIDPETFKKLCKIGAKQGLFKNSTIMSPILEVLAYWSLDKRLCVAVPVVPLHAQALTSNSTFIVIEWNGKCDSFSGRATSLQADILEGMNHLSFSGVDLARLLYEQCGCSPVLPVVITNGLSWPILPSTSPMTLYGGLTQTPQVAIDIRFTNGPEGSLVFDIDYARDAIAVSVIGDVLEGIKDAIKQIVTYENFSIDVQSSPRRPNELKPSAYLDKRQLLRIYIETLEKSRDFEFEPSMNFTDMGLLPKHLKMISARLRNDFSIEITPAQLLPCRNIDDVECLLVARNADGN